MRLTLRLLALLALSLLILTGCGDDDPGDLDATGTTTTEAATDGDDATEDDPGTDNTTPSQGIIEMTATLSGEAEVPGPGDDDGSGKAEVTIDVSQNEVCAQFTEIENVEGVVAAHIHRGEADESGPIVITLPAPKEGPDDEPDCNLDADRDIVTEIAGNPSGFYVNVHSEDYPAGAVRGQLTVS